MPRKYKQDPTPEEIERALAALQSQWSEREYRRRSREDRKRKRVQIREVSVWHEGKRVA